MGANSTFDEKSYSFQSALEQVIGVLSNNILVDIEIAADPNKTSEYIIAVSSLSLFRVRNQLFVSTFTD